VKTRVVFDTNVVISALIFTRGQLAWLRAHWREQRVHPLVSRETADELVRVLAYPKFRLGADEIHQLLEDYLPAAETILTVKAGSAPTCRDSSDQKFIDLANAGHADVLVTGDADLLTLREEVRFIIETPMEFRHDLLWDQG
jgi:putative PIN family toxin of toxin-antitoxin system